MLKNHFALLLLTLSFLTLTGQSAPAAAATALTCKKSLLSEAKLSAQAQANEDLIEQAGLLLNRNLKDDEIVAILNSRDNQLDTQSATQILKEAGFSGKEQKALIETEIAVPNSPIRISKEQWVAIEEVLNSKDFSPRGLPHAQKEKIREILRSGRPDMGRRLAEAAGHSVLIHKTLNLGLMSILKHGALIPGKNVKDKYIKQLLSAFSQDFGNGFNTFSYDRAYFQPLSPRWKRVKKASNACIFVFDLSLFNEASSDFGVFFAHASRGSVLRENPAGFLNQLLLAYGNNQSELKTPIGISLKHVKYIVVSPESRARYLAEIEAEKIQAPPGRTWNEIIVGSRYILGEK